MGRIQNSFQSNYASNLNSDNNTRGFRYPSFFKDGVEHITFRRPKSDQDTFKTRILPAFDYDVESNVDLFKTSYAPFMKSKGIYSEWVAFIRGYTWFGDLRTELISPDTVHIRNFEKYPFPRSGTDPISDLRSFIFFGKRDNKTLLDGVTPLISDEDYTLIAKPLSKNESVKLPAKPRVFAISNALIMEEGEWKVKILVYSEQVFNVLTTILKQYTPRSYTSIISENFPDLLFGDITDPVTGSVLYGKDIYNPAMKNDIFGLSPSLSKDNDDLTGRSCLEVTNDQLAKRYDLSDDENVLDIWTYERILDLLCKDPMVPIELLKKAEDNGVFKGRSLNYDLREEGEEIIAKREEARRLRESGQTEKVYSTPNSLSSLPKIDDNVYNTANDVNNHSHEGVLFQTYESQFSDIEQNNSNEKSEIENQNDSTEQDIEDKAKIVLSDDEYVFYKDMKEQMASGNKVINPEDMAKFFSLHNKVNS